MSIIFFMNTIDIIVMRFIIGDAMKGQTRRDKPKEEAMPSFSPFICLHVAFLRHSYTRPLEPLSRQSDIKRHTKTALEGADLVTAGNPDRFQHTGFVDENKGSGYSWPLVSLEDA